MKNLVQTGSVVTLVAPAAVLSGQGLLVGSLFGIATFDAASGADVEAQVDGVFDIAKTASQVIAQGGKCYWDNAAKSVTGVAAGNSLIGAALVAAAGVDATVRVRLNAITV